MLAVEGSGEGKDVDEEMGQSSERQRNREISDCFGGERIWERERRAIELTDTPLERFIGQHDSVVQRSDLRAREMISFHARHRTISAKSQVLGRALHLDRNRKRAE